MNIGIKTIERRFEFENKLSGLEPWVEEVIEGIEQPELKVYDPHDADALSVEFDPDRGECLDSGLTQSVDVREWLCVGCQHIGWGNIDELEGKPTEVIACYESNARKVLYPPYAERRPAGPAAFRGDIWVSKQLRMQSDLASRENWFKCIIAHELVHVFEQLQFLVPAFRNWPAFWENVLQEGYVCDVAVGRDNNRRLFVDAYGQDHELAMMQRFWPSKAEQWFEGFRGR